MTFKQDLNIYEWLYSLNFQKKFGNNLEFALKEEFRSTLQSISSRDLWKDSQNLDISFTYPISKKLSFAPKISSYVLADAFTTFNNDILHHSAGAQFDYRAHSKVRIASSISSQWQTQLQRDDHGYGYGWISDITDIDVNGYTNDLSFQAGQTFFPQRRNHDLKLRYQIEKNFYTATSDTLIIIFDRLRRDSFDSDATEEIFVRNLEKSNRGFENRLSYRISPDANLHVRSSLLATSFTVINKKEEANDLRKDELGFESEHLATLKVDRSRWKGNLSWNYRFRSRDDRRPKDQAANPFGPFSTVGFDIEDVLVGLNSRNRFKVSESDSISLYTSVSRFKYHTTDTTNSNDHDQLRWNLTLSHVHDFGASLKLTWRASAFLNHFVFISSRFSNDNNWERTIQLTPEVTYQPSHRLVSKQQFLVRAKYRTFDFDDAETSIRNSVSRQFAFKNTSHYILMNQTLVELTLNIELGDQGRFFSDGWRQSLSLSWRNQEIQMMLRHQPVRGLLFSPGGRFYQQTRWEYGVNADGILEKTVRDKHRNFGPMLEISFQPSSSVEFNFVGNLQVVNSSRRKTEYVNNFDVNLNWFF